MRDVILLKGLVVALIFSAMTGLSGNAEEISTIDDLLMKTLSGECLYTTIVSGGMEPTLGTGESVVINIQSYEDNAPCRGDIVLFSYPVDAYLGKNTNYVSRIIGEPGDNVIIENGEIYLNGSNTPLDEPYLKEEWSVRNDGFEYDVPEDAYLVLGDNRNNSSDSRYWAERALVEAYGAGKEISAEEAWNLSFVPREMIIGKVTDKVIFEAIKYD